MAKVTISTHNVTVPATSGSDAYALTLDGCVGYDVYTSGGTLTPTSLRLSRMGTDILIEWGANNSPAGLGTVIVVEAEDTGGNIVTDVMAFNQLGSDYNLSVYGQTDLEGDLGTGTYSLQSTVGGNFTLSPMASWLSVQSTTKTGSNSGTAVLSFTRNEGDPRTGVLRAQVTYQFNPYATSFYLVLTQGTYVERVSKLSYNPNSANVSYSEGIHTSPVPVMENVSNLEIRSVSGNMNIISTSLDQTNGAIIINYGANNSDDQKSATITVRATALSGYISATYTLYQGSYSYLVSPIWKTTTVDVAGRAYVDYTVSTEGNVVYGGRAYQMPDSDSISFELNEIVRDYIDNYLWWRPGYQTPSGWQRTFTVEMDNGDVGEYIFTKDWSYVERNYSSTPLICLNEPIINEIPGGCFVPICVFSPQRAGDVSFQYTDTQGQSHTSYDVHLDNPRQARYLSVSTPGYKYGYTSNGTTRSIYNGVPACQTRYVLYYENAYGGIDAMPVEGNATLTDKITAYTTKNQVRVPSTSYSYRRYLNEIQKTWEFKTGYLSDLQASRMHHLIESTMVYVYDIYADTLYPVVMDESSLTYKTYKNQGRKFFNYSFKVRESQDKIRK